MKNRAGSDNAKRSTWHSIVDWATTILVAVVAIWAVKWSGFALNIVATDSMLPTFRPTDMVVMISPKINKPEVGDIIVFTAVYLDTYIPPHVHRMVGVEPNGDFITKGDNAEKNDPWRVKPADVKGIVVGSAPTRLIRNPVLLGSFFFLFIAILLWPRNKSRDDQDPPNPPESEQEAALSSAGAGRSEATPVVYQLPQYLPPR